MGGTIPLVRWSQIGFDKLWPGNVRFSGEIVGNCFSACRGLFPLLGVTCSEYRGI